MTIKEQQQQMEGAGGALIQLSSLFMFSAILAAVCALLVIGIKVIWLVLVGLWGVV